MSHRWLDHALFEFLIRVTIFLPALVSINALPFLTFLLLLSRWHQMVGVAKRCIWLLLAFVQSVLDTLVEQVYHLGLILLIGFLFETRGDVLLACGRWNTIWKHIGRIDSWSVSTLEFKGLSQLRIHISGQISKRDLPSISIRWCSCQRLLEIVPQLFRIICIQWEFGVKDLHVDVLLGSFLAWLWAPAFTLLFLWWRGRRFVLPVLATILNLLHIFQTEAALLVLNFHS